MSFKLNVGSGERWLRIVGGIALLACGVFILKNSLLGFLVDLCGVAALVTGMVRWCPMCAIAGRRLQQ